MEFKQKLQQLRKNKNLSQEEFSVILDVSRQAVAKWESGLSYPDLQNLIQISDFFKVTIDNLIKDDFDCSKNIITNITMDDEELLTFICEAKKNTYANKLPESTAPIRDKAHEFSYIKDNLSYLDSYYGNDPFIGEEVVYSNGLPIWSMNYCGRVLNQDFSSAFLKETLLLVDKDYPFRGPLIYQNGNYAYHLNITGDLRWFYGKENIYYHNTKVYECFIHGCLLK